MLVKIIKNTKLLDKFFELCYNVCMIFERNLWGIDGMVDIRDLKSLGGDTVSVRVRYPLPFIEQIIIRW